VFRYIGMESQRSVTASLLADAEELRY